MDALKYKLEAYESVLTFINDMNALERKQEENKEFYIMNPEIKDNNFLFSVEKRADMFHCYYKKEFRIYFLNSNNTEKTTKEFEEELRQKLFEIVFESNKRKVKELQTKNLLKNELKRSHSCYLKQSLHF